MLKNHLIIAYRNLLKRKVYTLLNITGLVGAVAICLVILKFVEFELSYDQFHAKSDRIYRLVCNYKINGELRGTYPLSDFKFGPSLLLDLPEIKSYVRTHLMQGGAILSNEDNSVKFHEESDVQFADSTFFDIFTYNAIDGNLATALDLPNSIVITKSAANKYFGTTSNVVGRVLKISGSWWVNGDYQVTAVIEDVPENSHLMFNFMLSSHNLLRNDFYNNANGWSTEGNFVTYVELHPEGNVKELGEKMPVFIKKYLGSELAKTNSSANFTFQPIENIHTNPGLDFEPSVTIGMDLIYFLTILCAIILIIAWINYINLSTALAMERAREVGIKKVMGAYRSQLIKQFMFESVLINLASVLLAILVSVALLQLLNNITGKSLQMDFTEPKFLFVLAIIFTIGSIVSGIYPALVLSSFKPIAVLKGNVGNVKDGFSLRKTLVLFQFSASFILIVGTFGISRQMSFVRIHDKGFQSDQILIVNGPSSNSSQNIQERVRTFKTELSKLASLRAVTTSNAIPGGGYNWGTGIRKAGLERSENKSGSIVEVDTDFPETYEFEFISGHKWDPSVASDMRSVVINETAVKMFGLRTPELALAEKLVIENDTLAIIGVLKDYHWNSLKSQHTPFLFWPERVCQKLFSIRLAGGDLQESIGELERQYKSAFPDDPFEYYFLNDFYDQQYREDRQFEDIFNLFTVAAVVIACMGLWGLASHTVAIRMKEMSLRRVLGASTLNVISLLLIQFLTIVVLAGIIAVPISWYAMKDWLDNFAFRIAVTWDFFFIPLAILLAISTATISGQIIRCMTLNPADVLRSE